MDERLSTVVGHGDRRRSLEAIRDHLARTLEAHDTEHRRGCECECGPAVTDDRTVAAVAKELRAVITELAALPTGREESKVDDLAAAREARRRKAAGL